MSPTMQDFGIDQLSSEDRLALAETIWESVARETEQSPLSEGQRKGGDQMAPARSRN